MAPAKTKKKGGVATGLASKEVASGKKLLKNKKKGGNPSKSISNQGVYGKKPVANEKKSGTIVESASIAAVSDKKPTTSLKPDPQIASTSSTKNSAPGKDEETVSQVQATQSNRMKRTNEGGDASNNGRKEDKNQAGSHLENEKRGIKNEKHEDTKKRYEKSRKELSGLIFMCNSKTKPDCFRFRVMGISANRKYFVMGIKPGLKIFLFDFDLKLLYGIYEASSSGGMNLEPAAFGGSFPAQVRFIVHRDCLPIPENIFKKAIKDNYDERTHRFKTELTTSQVKHLTSLFQPVPILHSNGKSLVRETTPALVPNVCPVPASILHARESPKGQGYLNRDGSSKAGENFIPSDQKKHVPEHHISSSDVPPQGPLFLIEQEYRNRVLRPGSHVLPTATRGTVAHAWEPINVVEQEQKQFQKNPAFVNNEAGLQQRDSQPDAHFLSENEYRTYGLRGAQEMSTAVSSVVRANQAVEGHNMDALVNRYLSLPRTVAAPADLHPLTGRERLINDPNYATHAGVHLGRIVPDGERSYPSYTAHEPYEYNQISNTSHASREPSEYNQGYRLHGGGTNSKSSAVSNCYSFAGPSMLRH